MDADPVTHERLAALPQHSVDVQFSSGKGTEKHSESRRAAVGRARGARAGHDEPQERPTRLRRPRHGANGYAALVSYGEISPDFGNRGVLLATTQDGAALARPRLVVPGDVKGGRYVSDVVELRVVRVG